MHKHKVTTATNENEIVRGRKRKTIKTTRDTLLLQFEMFFLAQWEQLRSFCGVKSDSIIFFFLFSLYASAARGRSPACELSFVWSILYTSFRIALASTPRDFNSCLTPRTAFFFQSSHREAKLRRNLWGLHHTLCPTFCGRRSTWHTPANQLISH